ncbi:hypothetical protein HF846_13830 [Clostridium cadaveris]|uniref:hypothetical protein n=1 Tax=Clostridium cadaveris TaxID=1529 RepID=UPI001459791A|nr:hypothetical protein [Clostridium cadaveris]NME65675.1 hypothetical protein [Clostridium cadaveris]
MEYYLFRVWKDFDDEYKEVLVGAVDLEEAEDKLNESNIEFDDYEFIEEVSYDYVVI